MNTDPLSPNIHHVIEAISVAGLIVQLFNLSFSCYNAIKTRSRGSSNLAILMAMYTVIAFTITFTCFLRVDHNPLTPTNHGWLLIIQDTCLALANTGYILLIERRFKIVHGGLKRHTDRRYNILEITTAICGIMLTIILLVLDIYVYHRMGLASSSPDDLNDTYLEMIPLNNVALIMLVLSAPVIMIVDIVLSSWLLFDIYSVKSKLKEKYCPTSSFVEMDTVDDMGTQPSQQRWTFRTLFLCTILGLTSMVVLSTIGVVLLLISNLFLVTGSNIHYIFNQIALFAVITHQSFALLFFFSIRQFGTGTRENIGFRKGRSGIYP